MEADRARHRACACGGYKVAQIRRATRDAAQQARQENATRVALQLAQQDAAQAEAAESVR